MYGSEGITLLLKKFKDCDIIWISHCIYLYILISCVYGQDYLYDEHFPFLKPDVLLRSHENEIDV